MKTPELTVILAEDEQDLRNSAQLAFRMAGFSTRAFADGAEALSFIKQADPQQEYALVTDILMPRLSGLDLIREAKGLYPYMPTVAVTGYGDKPMVTELLRCGCDDFLDKPYAAEYLIEVLKRVIQLQKQRQDAAWVRLKAIESMEREWQDRLHGRPLPDGSTHHTEKNAAHPTPDGQDFLLTHNAAQTILSPTGALRGERSRRFRHCLEEWLSTGGKTLVLDLSQVNDMDALALSILCALAHEIRAIEGSLTLVRVTSAVRSLLTYLKLDREFTLSDDRGKKLESDE